MSNQAWTETGTLPINWKCAGCKSYTWIGIIPPTECPRCLQEKAMNKPPQGAINEAIAASLLSPCRSKRGAAVWNENKGVVSTGFNHKPIGFSCDGSDECKKTCNKEAVHAEQSVLICTDEAFGANMLHLKTVDGQLVPSGPPSCIDCSKLILEAGIQYMWLYQNTGWRCYTAVEFHRATLSNYAKKISVESTK